MRCERAIKLMRAVYSKGEAVCSKAEKDELKALSLISDSEPPMRSIAAEKEIASLRSRLAEILSRKTELQRLLERVGSSSSGMPRILYRKDEAYRRAMDESEVLAKEERMLRSRILDLIPSANAGKVAILGGEPTVLTFKGTETLTMLEERGRKVLVVDLHSFMDEMDRMRRHFMDRADSARTILQNLSPKWPAVEEIQLRNIAVGLSGRKGRASHTADLFHECMMSLGEVPAEILPLFSLGESIVLSSTDKADMSRRIEQARGMLTSPWTGSSILDDQVLATGILVAHGGDLERLRFNTVSLSQQGGLVTGALLACIEGDRARSVYEDYLSHGKLQTEGAERYLAAAILAVSGLETDGLLERFNEAQSMFSALGIPEFGVPSAMLAVLPIDVRESMDNLRYTSHCIFSKQLSVGSLETLSLGMKMLMGSSIMSGASRMSEDVSLSSLISDVPVGIAMESANLRNVLWLATGMNAFHRITLHSLAVSEDKFHPTHVHSVYPSNRHYGGFYG